jgi:pyruvate/2-oxoglutarate dehydrogenase complex dihydrolipoamide dehydrogenase (E3) component
MSAAITAAERGLHVILAEKEKRLGGLLWFTDVDEHKESLKRYRDSLVIRCQRTGVDIRLGTEVTKEYIENLKPDAVICAAGSRANIPPIEGIEYALHALDVYAAPGKAGKKIVMIGGGLIGCETGLWLSDHGHDVHILEMRGDVAIDANDSHRRALIPLMKERMSWDVNVTVTSVDASGVHFTDPAGKDNFVAADTVVYAVGQRSNSEIAEELKGSCDWFVTVGDGLRARQVKQATYEGFCAAMDIL